MASPAGFAQEMGAQPGQFVEVRAKGISPGSNDVGLVDSEQSESATCRG